MEEKLYFKPASYGKGIKKQKGEPKSDRNAGEKDHRGCNLLFFLLFIIVIVIVVLYLLRGKAVTTGQYPANVKNESLVCDSDRIGYKVITRAKSDQKNLKINLTFSNEDNLKSIALIYTLYYETANDVKAAEAFAHAEFNESLYAIGYDIDKISNKFTRYDDRLIISLFASSSGITEYTGKYFMLDFQSSNEIPKTLEEYRNHYEAQGFVCKTTN